MSAVPNASVVFLPWVRQGAAAAINVADTLGANMRGAVDLKATLAINNVPGDPITVRLRGPADIVGIDPNEIVRVDPKPNTTDFEPNYFPGIEFDRPDFPWLFTPAKAGPNAKLRPWLCLVVVRQQEGVMLSSSADAPLPILNINGPARPADELPDLVDSWAWVHAQVAASSLAQTDPNLLKNDMRSRPERSLSRLLCPRILQPNTDYLACVVPTFELGRRAGLGEEIKEAELTAVSALESAWSFTPPSPPPTSVRLPVYYHWRFRTGEGGDFESLVRLLRAVPAPAELGKRPMDISQPGFKLPSTFPHEAQLSLEGALRPLENRALAPWPGDAQEPFQTELAKIVNAAGEALIIDPDSDPLLAPPLYGQWHAARSTIARGAAPWFDDLNLDPRHRSISAFGTRVVQEHQEALMASAWEQAGDLQRANQRMRQLQLSLVVGISLHARHFKNLSDDAILRVSAPALARLRAVGAMGVTGTLAGAVASSALPLQAASTAMRRIARARGPITRRIAAQGLVRSATPNWMTVLNSAVAFNFLTPALPDMATFGIVRGRVTQSAILSQSREVTAEAVGNVAGRPHFRIAAEGQPVFHPGRYRPVPLVGNPTSRNFRLAAQAHLARVNPNRIGIIFALPPSLAMQDLRNALVTQTEPRRTLVPLAQAIISMSETAIATPPTNTGIVPIEPIMAAPNFSQPMYESLRDLSQHMLLPGLETVEPNSVLGLETNSRFVEAYMVGLNFEMGRELLWRGYPTDQRGTYFDRFWDSRSSGGGADVHPIHAWRDRPLGDPRTALAGDRFVMLIRSSLLRRYPSAVIYAAKAIKPNGVRKPTKSPDDEEHPVFRGAMQPDVTFFGFDLTVDQVAGIGEGDDHGYFIVIQEQPGEPRFGFDAGTPLNEGSHLKVSFGAPAGSTTAPNLHWGQNGAHIAAMLRQQPVRIAIHASQFLKKI
jgi:hypothetical protein